MNMINNSKQRFLTGALCFFMASVTAVPLTAQEKPAEAEAPEMTEQTEKAIERGLTFLISSQNKDGSWSTKDPAKGGGGGYAIAGTSLGLMAFMVEDQHIVVCKYHLLNMLCLFQ